MKKRVNLPKGNKIVFITDIEGNSEYFKRTLERVKDDVHLNEKNEIILSDNVVLVYGGDGPDKGSGDKLVCKALSAAKKKYPDRVVIILGNRDANKLRFLSELATGKLGHDIDIYWDQKHKTYKDFIKERNLADDQISTLKWMLHSTMGCQTTWELRRKELVGIRGVKEEIVTDEDIFKSFKDSADPDLPPEEAWMLEYIKSGQIMAAIGNYLFVHGGIQKEQLGRVPGKEKVFEDVGEWCEELNNWCDKEISDYMKWRPGMEGVRGGDALMDYSVIGGQNNSTVMYNHWLENGNCKAVNADVAEYLRKNGVWMVVTGHQPHGQSPSVIRYPYDDVTVLMCDTSYSDIKAEDNRGEALYDVVLRENEASVNGILSDGKTYSYTLLKDRNGEEPYSNLVGRQLSDESWVKGILSDTSEKKRVITAKGEGFRLPHVYRTLEETKEHLKLD